MIFNKDSSLTFFSLSSNLSLYLKWMMMVGIKMTRLVTIRKIWGLVIAFERPIYLANYFDVIFKNNSPPKTIPMVCMIP